jgi:hypothetical protein
MAWAVPNCSRMSTISSAIKPNPGTVDIVVLPPISVKTWMLKDLPKRIAEVRQIYVDTLNDWPEGQPRS